MQKKREECRGESFIATQKKVTNWVCDAIVAAIKEKVAFAKQQHKRVSRGRFVFPEFIKIAFQPALLTVSSNMKSLMVQADADCYRWMGSALVKEIEKKMTCGVSRQDPDANQLWCRQAAISGKIHWSRRERTWRLETWNAQETVADYLRRESISLHVPPGLSRAAYKKARHKTFLAAIRSWNELDRSDRFRIRFPAKVERDVLNIPKQEEIFTAIEFESDNDAESSEETA